MDAAPAAIGLPPPTRGILPTSLRHCRARRSTPAHAGNTHCALPPLFVFEVYPRPRGEYINIGWFARYARGLPPPTRGILGRVFCYMDGSGSTPAHAGNTGHYRNAAQPVQVYPRPRGEYRRTRTACRGSGGLPPPTRGIRMQVRPLALHQGSTPAHAGNTRASPTSSSRLPVYPRPRGEYPGRKPTSITSPGLPPPTRGIQADSSMRPPSPRSTPAHAGNTRARLKRAHTGEVYPRPRGEYRAASIATLAALGLPPPTRGILDGRLTGGG